MKRLDGKVAIITGGGGGIGGATARRLVGEGANVVVADISLDSANRVCAGLGDRALAVHLDAADENSCEAVVAATLDRFGRVDILHNNHALLNENMPEDRTVVDTPFSVWDNTMAINLRGYFAMAKFAVPHMVEQGGGSVVNMTSDSGIKSDSLHIAYGVSKAAIIMLTQAMALQHGKAGVRTNGIAPGLVVTDNVRKVAPELITLLERHTPAPELGEPDDIAALVAFLACDDARFINGQIISCDGGLLSHMPQTADLSDWLAGKRDG